jgi:hypothetical protein
MFSIIIYPIATWFDHFSEGQGWGSSWGLGSEEGPGVVSHHTPTSKKKFGNP